MRSGIEMIDCEKLKALARPASLKGSPAQSTGLGPPPRSSASSWLMAAQDPARSISAAARPLCDRFSLERRRRTRERLPVAEVKRTSLLAGIAIHAQSLLVLPGN